MAQQHFEIGGASKQEEPGALRFPRSHRGRYADFRCDLVADFFTTASFAAFLPVIGISISFWPADAFLDFLAGFFGAWVSAEAPLTLRRSASIRSTTFSPFGLSLGLMVLPLEAKGKPVDFKELLRMEPDSGTTNIRNVKSKHWTRWLGPENRCVVLFNSFSEFNKGESGDVWFALDETRPLACFAGIWTNWTSVRKVKEGETTNDLYAFLTTEPNAEVGAVHPKAMPVILATTDEVETWMTASPDEALRLQRPLPDGALRIVARGVKEDPAGSAP